MAADYRFSRADSEWSHCSREADGYGESTGQDDLSRPQLYDLPPEAFSKKRISSVGQTSDCENKEEKQNLHPGADAQKRTALNEFQVPTWLKIYLFVISVGFAILLGLVSYAVYSQLSRHDEELNFKRFDEPSSRQKYRSQEFEKMQMQVDGISRVTYVILELIRTCSPPVVRRNSTKTNSKTGCLPGDVRNNNTCYSVHRSAEKINYEAETDCWQERAGSKLARFRTKNVQAFLGASLSRGSSLWIDGRKAEGGNVFKFSDGSVVDASWMSSSDDGDCLSLEVSTATVTWHRRSCFDKLKGYICQYQASSVNKT